MPEHPLFDALNSVIEEESANVLAMLADRPPVVSLGILGYVSAVLFRQLPSEDRLKAFDRWAAITRDNLQS